MVYLATVYKPTLNKLLIIKNKPPFIFMPLPRIIWKVTSFPDKRFSPWQWPYSMDTGSEVCFNPRWPLSTLHHLLFFGHTFAMCIRMPLPRIIWKVTSFPDICSFHHNNSPMAWTQVQKFVLILGVPLALSTTFYFSVHTFATCIRMPLPRIIWKVTSFPDKPFSPWQWPYSMDTGSEVCFNPRWPLSTLHHLLFFGHTFAMCIRMPLPRIIWKVTSFPDIWFSP